MRLIPVSRRSEEHARILYELLRQRPPEACVSHKSMPTFDAHLEFVRAHPYYDWCLIETGEGPYIIAGSVFISMPARPSVVGDELHVELFPDYRGEGLAAEALKMMMARHPRRRYIANVAPGNEASRALFERLGFRHCQNTLELLMGPGHDSA